MFQGSAHVGPGQHHQLLSARGATEINGRTGLDVTQYYQTVPRHELELALWLEADRMGFLAERLTEANLAREKQVVLNERKETVNDEPYGLADELVMRNLFPKGHPYHANLIGIPDEINAATLSEIKDFYLTYYTPANATLALAGDFDPEVARALITKYFASLRGRAKPAAPVVEAPRLPGAMEVMMDEPVAVRPRLTVAWLGPRTGEPGTLELDLLAALLAEAGGPLDNLLADYKLDAEDVDVSFQETHGGSIFRIDVILREGEQLRLAQEIIENLVRQLKVLQVLKETLDHHLAVQNRALWFGIQSASTRGHLLQAYQRRFGEPAGLNKDLARYRQVTPQGLKQASDLFLTRNRLNLFALPNANPKGGAR